MNAREARQIVQRWVASNLLLGEGWGSAGVSLADESRLATAAERIAREMLDRAWHPGDGEEARPRATLAEIVVDVLGESYVVTPSVRPECGSCMHCAHGYFEKCESARRAR